MKRFLLAAAAVASLALAGCANNADVASANISKAADNFEIPRRVVLYNGITDQYIQLVQGLCSLGNHDEAGTVSVTCKNDAGRFLKHIWILGDNVTVFAEQLDAVDVSTDFYRVTFKPTAIIPDVRLQVGN